MEVRIFFKRSRKLIVVTIFLLILAALPVHAALWGNKTDINTEDFQRIVTELRIYDDPDLPYYNEIFRLYYAYYTGSEELLDALNKKIEITQQAMKILDADIKKEELGNLTYGRYILNAINEKELVEIGLKMGSSNQADGEYFSKLGENLADWESQLSKLLLTKIIVATCTAMGAPALSIGISTLGLFCDLSIIKISINKFHEVWYEKAFWSYMQFRNEHKSDHIGAWTPYAEPYVNYIINLSLLSLEKQKKAREAIEENFKFLWNKYGDHIVNNELDNNFKTQQRESLKILLLYALGAGPHPLITSPLKITPDSPYYGGDTINAEFTITNQGKLPIDFSVLTIGGRDPDNHVSDFTHRQNITLEPSKSYNYQGALTLNKVGNYHFFCAYQTPNDEWNTNIDLGSGLTDEDRTRDIVVKEKPSTFGGSNIVPPTATATALVIDHSGSMGDKRKLELAQEAARSYIDSVPEEDYVSVAGFSTDASSIVGLSSIKTSKEKLKQCILSLHSTSSTNIGAGLRVGMEQIFVEGQRPQKPIILLLSDGMHNTGELWPWVEECKRKQVKVYTVAFGSDADQVTLCKIAYQTGGRCFPAGIKNLSHIYHKANIYVHNNSTLFASSDWLKPGQELKYKVDVPSDFRNLTFFTNWQGSSIQTVVVKPDGSLIYPSSQMGDYQKGNTYSIFRVPAETGIWELRLSGQDLPQEGEQINVSISGKSETYSNFLTFQPEYKQGQRVLIRVEVADVAGNQKIPLENIKVKAKIEGPTPQLLKKVGERKFEINPFKILMGLILKQQEIDLYDDGAHDDYDPKDGIYGGTFLGGDIPGPYLVTAIIEGQSQGKIISRQIQESFQIGPIQNNKLTISDFIKIRHR